MKDEFNSRFNLLEAKRKKLFEELKSYSDYALNQKPNPQAWSVAEIIAHLMAADEASLLYLQKKTLGAANAEKSGIKGNWRLFVLKTAFNIPMKFKAPTVTTPPATYTTLKELHEKWDAIKKETLTLVNKLTDEDFKKELWRHPVSGKMNLLHMIDFTAIHFDRHKQQIERTLKIIKG